NRVHDILTAVAYAGQLQGTKKIHLVGWEEAGPWVLLTRALCGDAVAGTAADMNQFRFEKVTKTDDPMMLPGAFKYGGLSALAALCAPSELWIQNTAGTGWDKWVKPAYEAAQASQRLRETAQKVAGTEIIDWLMR